MTEPDKQIYYAHSLKIYNTKREKKELRFLEKKFNIIFNPKTELKWDTLAKMEPYLKEVQNSNLIVASEYKKHIGKGVYEEINTALKNQIPAFCLKKRLFRYKIVKIKSIRYIGLDWEIYYGKIIVNSNS